MHDDTAQHRTTVRPAITFDGLCARFAAVGVHVGVDLAGGRHAILLEDPRDGRAIRFPVQRDFDHAAVCLVLSACLRESFADAIAVPDEAPGVVYRGRWPEFLALWPAGTAAPGPR